MKKIYWLIYILSLCNKLKNSVFIFSVYYWDWIHKYTWYSKYIPIFSLNTHCVKGVRVRNVSGSHILAIGLNTKIYRVNFRISPSLGNCGTKKLRILTIFTQWQEYTDQIKSGVFKVLDWSSQIFTIYNFDFSFKYWRFTNCKGGNSSYSFLQSLAPNIGN